MNSRLSALKIISSVITNGNTLPHSFDSPLVQEISYGVIRYFHQLNFISRQLIEKPLKQQDLFYLILIGLYQLMYMRIPDHAVISETVNCCVDIKKPWAKKLVNAVLRNFQRNKDNLIQKVNANLEAYYSHPQWLIDEIKNSYPNDWENILIENNKPPPMSLRVNSSKIDRTKIPDTIIEQSTQTGVTLKKPVPISQLFGYDQGYVTVQGISSQFAAPLLELKKGQRVLDACAAPGGKTTHILEMEPGLEQVVALDIDPKRSEKIKENLKRLHLSADVIVGDAEKPKDWWDKKPFDRILLDAPCSATGIIRRHPDIKLLRRLTDVQLLAQKQYHLLKMLWPLLKPGGILVYSTCSILPAENQDVLNKFLKEQTDAKEIVIQAQWGTPVNPGRQLITHNVYDGFYYAVIRKLD